MTASTSAPVSASASASAATSQPPPQNGHADYNTGTLWRFTSPAGDVGHAFGTIHIGNPGELAVPDAVWRLLVSARRVVVEVESDRIDPKEAERLQRLPASESLEKRLSRREIEILRKRLVQAGLPSLTWARYKPWVLTQMLQSASHGAVQSLDERIIERARRSRIEVAPLETVREQYAAFECVDLADQIVLLKETLALQDAHFAAMNRDVLALYRLQHVGELMTLLVDRFPIGDAARAVEARSTRCVISDRNHRFARRLPPLIVPNSFIAIGAAHLVGEDGVLASLRAAGFRIDRVAPAGTTP